MPFPKPVCYRRFLFLPLCGLWCLLSLSVAASPDIGQVKVRGIYVENEPGNDHAYDVVRDHQDYLWVGTDNGLKRYDGYGFKHFVPDPDDPTSLGTSIAITLLVQSNGSIWAGGRNLNRFHPETETFSHYEASDGGIIWAMLEGVDGTIWLGGEGFGLRGFDPKQGKVVHQYFDKEQGGENALFITALSHGQEKGIIWVAANEGIFRFNSLTGEREYFSLPWRFEAGTDGVTGMIVDDKGDVWVATQQGLVVLDPRTRDTNIYRHDPNQPDSLSTNALWSVFQDSKGQIWIGTDKKGVHRYLPETDSFAHYPASERNPYTFPPASVDGIYEDSKGSLWFSVRKYGVRRISEHLEKFRTIRYRGDDKNTLSFDNILDLLEDRHGRIWIATDGGGLNRYDPVSGAFTHYRNNSRDPGSLSSDSVISLAENVDGTIWAGTWAGGINIYNPRTNSFSHIKSIPGVDESRSLANDNIFRLEPDGKGGMWISVWRRGIQHYDPESGVFTPYFPDQSGNAWRLYSASVQDVEYGIDGSKLWVGGYRGIERLDLKTHRSEKMFSETIHIVNDLFVAHDMLWIASSMGFYRLNTTTLELKGYTRADGLSDNYVSSIEQDLSGHFWLGTRSGLNRFDPATETFETFDERDGLSDSQFNNYSHLITRGGVMYFGGPKGITVFDPGRLPRNKAVPGLVFTDVDIFQNSVLNSTEKKYIERENGTIKKIILPYHMRDITFEFSALDFIAPTKNRYRYRLEGLESGWTEVDANRRRARYTNLDPGHYYFHVLGANNEGVWNEEGIGMGLTVLSPWWMTWWARTLMAGIAGLLVYAFIYWRLKATQHQQKQLRVMVTEKTRELEESNRYATDLNAELERRVEQRTQQLTVEASERRLAEDKLYHMAFHDALTGLPNRAWLLQKLETLMAERQSGGSTFALMFLDGDRFKQVNDTHGHLLGDRLLIAVADRLRHFNTEHYHAIRLGGDEFNLLIDTISGEEELLSLAQQVVDLFEEPFFIEQQHLHFKVSMGMVLCDETHTKPEHVLRDADIAMYRAKANGRGMCELFDARMREQAQEMAALESDLHEAIERNQFRVVYQPIIDLQTDTLTGFEALLRWHHPGKGFISPDKFIPLAEECGLIVSIGLWVLREACNQLGRWLMQFDFVTPPSIAVNMSSLQLNQLDLIDSIDYILEESRLDSNLLKLEITESVIMENGEMVNRLLDALRARGIELAIDDFGTGYSSLSYLDQLPVQVLKIDRQFVAAISGKEGNLDGKLEIVKATISLAHALKLKVVAEGIETAGQRNYLMEVGCDFGQGYLIAPPLSASDALGFIEKRMNVSARPLNVREIGEFDIAQEKSKHVRRLRDRRKKAGR